MPDFINGVKQAHLPEQAKLPGDETRFFKQEGSSGKSGDWMSELGKAASNFLEQGVKDILKAPVDIVNGAAKTIGDGLSSAAKGIYQGLKEAVQEIKQDIREAKSSPREPSARREPPAQQKDGQREAKSTPSPSQSARPATENKQEHQARNEPQAKTHEAAKPRERDSSQNNSPRYGQVRPNDPSSAMDQAQHQSRNPQHAATISIKVQDHKDPTVRAHTEPAKDSATRTSSIHAQTNSKEDAQAPIVRPNHAPASAAPNHEKAMATPTQNVNSEKVADAMIKKSVDSVLKEIRASNEIPKEKAQEKSRVPDKSPERTR